MEEVIFPEGIAPSPLSITPHPHPPTLPPQNNRSGVKEVIFPGGSAPRAPRPPSNHPPNHPRPLPPQHRSGVKEVIFPEGNRRDYEDVSPQQSRDCNACCSHAVTTHVAIAWQLLQYMWLSRACARGARRCTAVIWHTHAHPQHAGGC